MGFAKQILTLPSTTMSSRLNIEVTLLEHCEEVVAAMHALQVVTSLGEYTFMTRAVQLLVNITVRILSSFFLGFLSDRLNFSTT